MSRCILSLTGALDRQAHVRSRRASADPPVFLDPITRPAGLPAGHAGPSMHLFVARLHAEEFIADVVLSDDL